MALSGFVHDLGQLAGDLDGDADETGELAVLDRRRRHHGVVVRSAGLCGDRYAVPDLPGHRGIWFSRMALPIPPGAGLTLPPDWALQRVPGVAEGRPAPLVHRLGGGTVN